MVLASVATEREKLLVVALTCPLLTPFSPADMGLYRGAFGGAAALGRVRQMGQSCTLGKVFV